MHSRAGALSNEEMLNPVGGTCAENYQARWPANVAMVLRFSFHVTALDWRKVRCGRKGRHSGSIIPRNVREYSIEQGRKRHRPGYS